MIIEQKQNNVYISKIQNKPDGYKNKIKNKKNPK